MDNINCCIIAIQRNEPYLQYWIDYHLNQGISHIFLIDNNDSNNSIYLPKKYKDTVTIFPANNCDHIFVRCCQYKLYNLTLDYIKGINNINKIYTHVLVIDIDEYFWYSKGNIIDFINNEMTAPQIAIPWLCYSDNGYIYKKDLPYDNPIDNYSQIANTKWIKNEYKSFAVINDNTKLDVHFHNNDHHNIINNTNDVHIKHYRTQCLEEYIDKICLRNTNDSSWWFEHGKKTIQVYFNYNDITNEKLDAFKYFYNKYNLTMSEEDKQFIESNYK